jgi:hypothetical protein
MCLKSTAGGLDAGTDLTEEEVELLACGVS